MDINSSIKPVKSTDFSYHVFVDKKYHREAKKWCRENLGPRWEAFGNRSGVWCCFWGGTRCYAKYKYFFSSEEVAVLFSLKWA